MSTTYLRQENEPLFPDMIWSRPERKDQRGKLLIIGGHSEALQAPIDCVRGTESALAGKTTIVLPDALKKRLPAADNVLFVSSTPSGSLATSAVGPICSVASSCDAVVMAGDLGNNSETHIVIEQILEKLPSKNIVVAGDGADQLILRPESIGRNITLILNGSQMQKLIKQCGSSTPYTTSMSAHTLYELLTNLDISANIILMHSKQLWTLVNKQVCVTNRDDLQDDFKWLALTAGVAGTMLSQNQSKPFEALVTSCLPASSLSQE
ncbi:MAG: hypothetical protein AAF413_04610 [Patescibacteria group bacterium]